LLLIRERRNYQAVYFLMQGLHLAVGLPVARLLGKTILMKVGGSGVLPLMARSPTGRLELYWLRKWADRVMILNEGMRAEAVAARLPADKVVWMPNPVDAETFRPAGDAERRRLRAEHDLPADALVIIYTGRLAPEKSLHLLMEAFATVSWQRAEAYLVLVGDGPMKSALIEQTSRLGCAERTRFVGRVDPSEMPRWLQIADVFALVSLSEGFSCALVVSPAWSAISPRTSNWWSRRSTDSCRPLATSEPQRRRSCGCSTIASCERAWAWRHVAASRRSTRSSRYLSATKHCSARRSVPRVR
jgi:glycosyltransferase involved in cell wall biosynthesis